MTTPRKSRQPSREKIKEMPRTEDITEVKSKANEVVSSPEVPLPDILTKFLSLDTTTLRGVIDKAVSDWNNQKARTENNYNATENEYREEIDAANEEIERLEKEITQKKQHINMIEIDRARNDDTFDKAVRVLENQRVMIENVQALMSDKLKGFKD